LRSGTLPVPLCVGLGAAADIAKSEMGQEAERLTRMRNRLWDLLQQSDADLSLNGDLDRRLPGNLNITVPGVESSELLAALDGLSVSSGSACSSGAQAASHVLQALGHDPAKVAAGLRIGLGRFTTANDIAAAAEMLLAAVGKK
jgi:cysteine desulfurase